MRLPLVFKVSALVALGVVTSILTTRAMQAPSPRAASGRSPGGRTTTRPIRPDLAPPDLPVDRTVVASGAMHRLDIEAEGNRVWVAAVASIQDKRPNMSHVWTVRVFSPDDVEVVLFERRYDEQVFHVPPSSTAVELTFEDVLSLPLPTGDYLVEVAIYRVPPNHGLADLNDTRAARTLIGPSGRARINLENPRAPAFHRRR
jgi:hypothetical protein